MYCPRQGEKTRSQLREPTRKSSASLGGNCERAGYIKANGGSVKDNFRSLGFFAGFLPDFFGTKVHDPGHSLCFSVRLHTTSCCVDADNSESCLISNQRATTTPCFRSPPSGVQSPFQVTKMSSDQPVSS